MEQIIKREIHLFCANVKALRQREKLSKKEMAKRLGIGVGSLTKIESGTLPPRLTCNVLIKLHTCFGVSPEKMFLPFPKDEE